MVSSDLPSIHGLSGVACQPLYMCDPNGIACLAAYVARVAHNSISNVNTSRSVNSQCPDEPLIRLVGRLSLELLVSYRSPAHTHLLLPHSFLGKERNAI